MRLHRWGEAPLGGFNMNKTLLIALLAATLVTPLVAAEAHGDCDSKGAAALGIVAVETPAATIYVDDRNYAEGNGVWIYLESNGASGLQRGGSSAFVPDDPENCVDDSDVGPDTLIL
jgi:hypothetical protein